MPFSLRRDSDIRPSMKSSQSARCFLGSIRSTLLRPFLFVTYCISLIFFGCLKLLFLFLPLIPANQTPPAVRGLGGRLGKGNGGGPQRDLVRVRARHFTDFQRLTFRTARDFFRLLFFFLAGLGFFGLKTIEDLQRSYHLAIRYL